MKLWIELFRRFAFISSVVLWLGGFTFYAGVVIPTGAQVLHSHMRQGLVTQQVSGWLNLIGILALLFILWNALCAPRVGRVAQWGALGTWAAMAVMQVALFVLHPMMDRLIDSTRGKIRDDERFDSLHTLYGAISTAQWGCGVLHVIIILYIWMIATNRYDAAKVAELTDAHAP